MRYGGEHDEHYSSETTVSVSVAAIYENANGGHSRVVKRIRVVGTQQPCDTRVKRHVVAGSRCEWGIELGTRRCTEGQRLRG